LACSTRGKIYFGIFCIYNDHKVICDVSTNQMSTGMLGKKSRDVYEAEQGEIVDDIYFVTIIDASEGSEVTIYTADINKATKSKLVKKRLFLLLENGKRVFENIGDGEFGDLCDEDDENFEEKSEKFVDFMDKICVLENKFPDNGLSHENVFGAKWIITRPCV